MEKYNILINRNNLTAEQMVEGLEFNKVKNYYAAYKKNAVKSAAQKSIIIKLLIGITMLIVGIGIYTFVVSLNQKQASIVATPVETSILENKAAPILHPITANQNSVSTGNIGNIKTKPINSANLTSDSLIMADLPYEMFKHKEDFINNENPATINNTESVGLNSPDVSQLTSKIYFIRSTGFTGSALAFRVFINDTLTCKLNNKSYSIHEVSPVEHIITVQSTGKKVKPSSARITIYIEAGKTYYINMIYKVGLIENSLTCEEVSEKSAQIMIQQLKEDKDCK